MWLSCIYLSATVDNPLVRIRCKIRHLIVRLKISVHILINLVLSSDMQKLVSWDVVKLPPENK